MSEFFTFQPRPNSQSQHISIVSNKNDDINTATDRELFSITHTVAKLVHTIRTDSSCNIHACKGCDHPSLYLSSKHVHRHTVNNIHYDTTDCTNMLVNAVITNDHKVCRNKKITSHLNHGTLCRCGYNSSNIERPSSAT